jgi:hypothetical protein
LQLGTAEVLDNILPVGRVVEATQIGLQLAAKNLESRALADAVGADETEDVSGAGHRQAVELEAIGRVAVGDLAFEVGGQVDDGNGVEWAFLRADAAADAERLGDEGEARLGRDFDAELARADDRAGLLAFLTAFLKGLRVRGGGRQQRSNVAGGGRVVDERWSVPSACTVGGGRSLVSHGRRVAG